MSDFYIVVTCNYLKSSKKTFKFMDDCLKHIVDVHRKTIKDEQKNFDALKSIISAKEKEYLKAKANTGFENLEIRLKNDLKELKTKFKEAKNVIEELTFPPTVGMAVKGNAYIYKIDKRMDKWKDIFLIREN